MPPSRRLTSWWVTKSRFWLSAHRLTSDNLRRLSALLAQLADKERLQQFHRLAPWSRGSQPQLHSGIASIPSRAPSTFSRDKIVASRETLIEIPVCRLAWSPPDGVLRSSRPTAAGRVVVLTHLPKLDDRPLGGDKHLDCGECRPPIKRCLRACGYRRWDGLPYRALVEVGCQPAHDIFLPFHDHLG